MAQITDVQELKADLAEKNQYKTDVLRRITVGYRQRSEFIHKVGLNTRHSSDFENCPEEICKLSRLDLKQAETFLDKLDDEQGV